MPQRTPIGQILVQEHFISDQDLQRALAVQTKTKERLGEILIQLGVMAHDARFFSLLAKQMGVPYVDLKETEIPSAVLACVPAQLASHYKIIPVQSHNGQLALATSDPWDILKLDELSAALRCEVRPVLADEKAILESIRKYYGLGAETIERMMAQGQGRSGEEVQVKDIEELTTEASIGAFLNQLILEAYRERATDIHIEPCENELQVRYRIDGFLRDAKVPQNIRHFKDPINSRIKILSNLNIAQRRLPQDGRFKVKVGDTQLDLRVSFLPTAFGESAVIRILNANQLFDIERLGLASRELKILDELIKKPHGLIFVTGPTGSGKTTTLYSCLSRVNSAERKILTIEDPAEYQLAGITQIQVNPAIGLTFAQGLRSMLRHDPDIMMVGEVRDHETAQIAIQVALTGHLVFSTLHTNDAASAVTRLLDMGVEPYLISSSVIGFIAQRLVRLICPHCKEPRVLSPEVLADFDLDQNPGRVSTFVGKGCRMCQSTGYLGRQGIYEFLILNEDMQKLIHRRASASEIRTKAMEKGMKTLRQDGWEKIKMGSTTPEEVIRVTAGDF